MEKEREVRREGKGKKKRREKYQLLYYIIIFILYYTNLKYPYSNLLLEFNMSNTAVVTLVNKDPTKNLPKLGSPAGLCFESENDNGKMKILIAGKYSFNI